MAVVRLGPLQRGVEYWAMKKIVIFQPISLFVSEMIQDSATVRPTMERKYETAPKFSNGTIFSDLE